jgi:hypothetical protein
MPRVAEHNPPRPGILKERYEMFRKWIACLIVVCAAGCPMGQPNRFEVGPALLAACPGETEPDLIAGLHSAEVMRRAGVSRSAMIAATGISCNEFGNSVSSCQRCSQAMINQVYGAW